MTTSKQGIELIKAFEGFRSKAYKVVSTEKYYTIGYGHYGADVKRGQTITDDQGEQLLVNDIKKFEAKVNEYNNRYNFNQHEFDALVSFAYNIGSIDQLTDNSKRSRADIRAHWLEYNKSGGKVLKGLTTRRTKELELFNTPVTADIVNSTDTGADKVNSKLSELDNLVRDTIAGKYGSGYNRRTALGSKYSYVQNVINFIYYT